MRETFLDFCLRTDQRALLGQWDHQKNLPLLPESISYGSKQLVWWKCEKGHSWQAAVTTRTANHSGCPYCSHQRAWPGESDLQTLYPELMREWDFEKNGDLLPDQLLPGSSRKVWWKCAHGHSWQAIIKSRVQGAGCPVCTNRAILAEENSLAVTHPKVAGQWDAHKNHSLTARDVVAGSHRKVWWKCAQGHSWQASIVSRAHSGAGCPVCAGKVVVPGENDLASQFPQVAREWNTAKNAPLTAQQVSAYSNLRVWWVCALGHEWKAAIAARTHNTTGCPYCAGRLVLAGFNDLQSCFPEIAMQWHPTLNGSLTPDAVTYGSKKKVWWKCPEGHVWRAVVYSRTGAKKCGCPVCAGRVRQHKQIRYRKMIGERQLATAASRFE